jgi:hypothetical protein
VHTTWTRKSHKMKVPVQHHIEKNQLGNNGYKQKHINMNKLSVQHNGI